MSRKWRWVAVLAAMLVGISTAVWAADPTYRGYRIVNLFLNDKRVAGDVPPIILDGRTLLPVRALAEALGNDVKWDGETSTVTLTGRSGLDWGETAGKIRLHLKGIKQLTAQDVGDDTLAGRLVMAVQIVNDGTMDQEIDVSNIRLLGSAGGGTAKSFVVPHVLEVTGDKVPAKGTTKVTLARGERVTANLAFDLKAADGVTHSDLRLVMVNPTGGTEVALSIKITITIDCSRRPCVITIEISF